VELEAAEDALAGAYHAREIRRIAQHAETLADSSSARAPISQKTADRLKSAAVMLKRAVSGETRANTTEVDRVLSEALSLVRQTFGLEIVADQAAFNELSENSDRQLVTVAMLALLIPIAALALLIVFRRRVLHPLHDLQYLMALANLRGEVDAAEHIERLTTVINELARMARVLNNIVNESRISPERPQRLQISRAVDELVRLMRYQLSSNIALTTDVAEDIYCRLPDAGFRHVLLNMVSNAAQAIGERPGTVAISAALSEGHAELVISDDGPGFPEELMEAGVHEYGSWRKGGTGLGLATARRFAHQHGTRLELKNKPEAGAMVILRLPVEDCDSR
jgi:signal transduction histidine kinase